MFQFFLFWNVHFKVDNNDNDEQQQLERAHQGTIMRHVLLRTWFIHLQNSQLWINKMISEGMNLIKMLLLVFVYFHSLWSEITRPNESNRKKDR